MTGSNLTAAAIIDLLGMRPLPNEGGWFVETHRGDPLHPAAVPPGLTGDRVHTTAIYYLMTPDGFSALHRLPIAELFHFYLGDPVEQLLLYPDGTGRLVRLGTDLSAGERPQSLVPAGIWQGSRLAAGGACGFALLGTTLAPGFEFRDYEHGDRAALLAGWPAWRDHILALTRHPEPGPETARAD